MSHYLCISIRFLQPYCHARADQGQPEWPPSPLRLFQAMTAAAAGHWNERVELQTAKAALQWLEQQTLEKIVAPRGTPSHTKHRLYVPDNVSDKVASSWTRGGTASIADHRTEKDVLPIQLDGEVVHYLWPLIDGQCPHLEVLQAAARAVPHLGWGLDVVAGNAEVLAEDEAEVLAGESWTPAPTGHGVPLRTTTSGTLSDLMRKHQEFLNRLGKDDHGNDSFRPVSPLSCFEVVPFHRVGDPVGRPFVIFKLGQEQDHGKNFPYPQHKLIHIAGMVRHLAIRAMASKKLLEKLYPDYDQTKDPFRDGMPPSGIESPDDWVLQYVAGHVKPDDSEHHQFSYLPLSSIGHRHVDQAVRRVMIVAPQGEERHLEHLAKSLQGLQLKPERGNEFGVDEDNKPNAPPVLIRIHGDKVTRLYAESSNAWASVTPVILPGYTDRKAKKTIRLIERSLKEAGIEQPCTFEWSPISFFPKSLPAHNKDRKGNWIYIKQDYLQNFSAVHLKITFDDDLDVSGPLALGAGRHCGFGVMAHCRARKQDQS